MELAVMHLLIQLKFGTEYMYRNGLKITLLFIIVLYFTSCDQNSTPTDPVAENVEKSTEVANLKATIIQETKISLEWEDEAAAEIGFEIFERSGSEGEFIPLMLTDPNVTIVMLDKHRQAFDYCYKVRAMNNDGASGFSNEARVVGFQLAGVVDGTGHMHDIEFSPDGRLIAVAGEFTSSSGEGGVVILDANGGGIVSILSTENRRGNMIGRCVKFSPDGKQLLVGTADGRLHIWDVQSWELQNIYLEEMEVDTWISGIRSIDFSQSGKYLVATMSTPNTILIWEYGAPLSIVRLIDLGYQYKDIHVRLSSDDNYLAVIGFRPPTGEFLSLAIYRTSDLVRTMYIQVDYEFRGEPHFRQSSVAFSPNTPLLVISDGIETRIINYITGNIEKTFDFRENHVSYSSNGEYLVSSSRTINFYDPDSGENVFFLDPFKGDNDELDIRNFDVDYIYGRIAIIKSNWGIERMDSIIEIWH